MKLILWCFFCFSLNFAAECQEILYGLHGKPIHLRISLRNQSLQKKDITWRRFNKQQLLASSKGIHPDLQKRMTFNSSDLSLTINKLNESDSGLYEALLNWEKDTVAAYTIIVENTISEPVIKVHDFNSSTGECLATVNCSVDGSWATYDCQKSHCTETQSSLSSISITVTAADRGIQCHVNNHVSRNHSEAPNIACHEKQHSELQPPPPLMFWVVIGVCVVVLLGLIMTLIGVIVKKRNSSKIHPQSQTTHRIVQSPSTSSENNPVATIYDVPVRHPKAPRADSEEVMTENKEEPQPGLDRTLKVRATVHQTEDDDPGKINTVYCKLGEI
ncbi:uncharacterized protein si:ch1073-220m6.1 [Danio aesculapii]|uniref:uncharacterized protein si:ch1073-220m6.1 n=1 Tax=Danio aesculapii TaxID=1142201 RepID=UPI0024BF50D3|nr:uncharacterized protein si:ch1073-220m6.1 [Danio aesculapii]